MFQTELYLLFMRSCYIVGLSAKAISRLVDDTMIKMMLVIIMMLIVVVMKMMMVMTTTMKLGGFDRNDNAYLSQLWAKGMTSKYKNCGKVILAFN